MVELFVEDYPFGFLKIEDFESIAGAEKEMLSRYDGGMKVDFLIKDSGMEYYYPSYKLFPEPCPRCGEEARPFQMYRTWDCYGIPFRRVCRKCYEKVLEIGFDGMEAWSIVSANLAHLVRIRRSQGNPKGFVDAESEAEVIAFKALQEMQQRMYPKPLKFKDVILLLDQPVWVEFIDAPELNCWGIVESVSYICNKHYLYLQGRMGEIVWDKNVRVYRHKPAEVNENA